MWKEREKRKIKKHGSEKKLFKVYMLINKQNSITFKNSSDVHSKTHNEWRGGIKLKLTS